MDDAHDAVTNAITNRRILVMRLLYLKRSKTVKRAYLLAISLVLLVGAGLALGMLAQEGEAPAAAARAATAPPPLSDVQRLTLQVKVKDLQLAQLRFEMLKADLTAYAKSLERDGYELDVDTGTYKAKAKAR